MNATEPTAEKNAAKLPGWLMRPEVRRVAAAATGLLVLALCLILPMVGKAAVHGSGSPGAGPMDTLWKNHLFFNLALLAALATGALTVFLQWVAADAAGERRPTGMLWVVAGVAVLGICHWTGLLGI